MEKGKRSSGKENFFRGCEREYIGSNAFLKKAAVSLFYILLTVLLHIRKKKKKNDKERFKTIFGLRDNALYFLFYENISFEYRVVSSFSLVVIRV